MRAMSLLMAISIRSGNYSLERVPSQLREQVEERLERLKGAEQNE